MTHLETIQNRIYKPEQIKRKLAVWHFFERKIVWTNGVFDLLHLGHIDYLSKAKDLGDILIVGINTDKSVRRIKKKGRPVNDETARSTLVASFHFVDAVILFDEDTPYNLIKLVQPDILVKGSDYKAKEIVGADLVEARGGKVETISFLPGYSTTLIEEKIKKS